MGWEGESGGEEEWRFYLSLVRNIVCVHNFLSLSLILKLVLIHLRLKGSQKVLVWSQLEGLG